jgi:hypothetical protein
MEIFSSDIPAYIKSTVFNWYFLGPGLVMIVLELLDKVAGWKAPGKTYIHLVFTACLVVAMFLTWQDVYHDNQRLSIELEIARNEATLSAGKDRQIIELQQLQHGNEAKLQSMQKQIEQYEVKRLKAASSSPTGIGKASERDSSGVWRRLTDGDRTKLSLLFSDGSLHKIRIYRTPTPDCIRLAEDFYKFFDQLQWTQTHRPESPYDWEIRPGIYVATIPDNVLLGKIKNIKEQSGAIALIKGIESIGFPVISDSWSGNVDNLEIHLHIGVKPE